MFFKSHEFKQKQKTTFTIIRDLQVKIVRIIVNVFKFIVDLILNIKLFLLFIEQQLNKMIFNFFFHIKISFWYEFIINHHTLSNQNLSSNMTQHQRFFYAQLSFLHKLKWCYVLIFNQNLIFFKRYILFLMIL